MVWEPRTYRRSVDAAGLRTVEVTLAETDLQVSAATDVAREARELAATVRGELTAYIAKHPRFAESFVPLDVERDAPEVVRAMADAARACGVGPMAAVAGAIAERVARGLAAHSAEVVVENGGDIFLFGEIDRTVAVWAGDSPLAGHVALRVPAERIPCAVCTSSGRMGHSASFGAAHTVTVLAGDGALADAAATALANRVHAAADAREVAEQGRTIEGVRGVLVIVGETLAASGEVELVATSGR